MTDVQTMEQSLGGVNGFFLFRMGSRFTVVLGLLGLVLARRRRLQRDLLRGIAEDT